MCMCPCSIAAAKVKKKIVNFKNVRGGIERKEGRKNEDE